MDYVDYAGLECRERSRLEKGSGSHHTIDGPCHGGERAFCCLCLGERQWMGVRPPAKGRDMECCGRE